MTQFCPNEDQAWRCGSCWTMGSWQTRYMGEPAAVDTEDKQLLGVFSLCNFPSEDQHVGGSSGLDHRGYLTVPDVQPAATGPGDKALRDLFSFGSLAFKGLPWLVLFSSAWHSRCSKTLLAGVLLYCSVQQASKGPFWPWSLLLNTSGTQRTTLCGVFLHD